jgi:hypothetical protein
MDAERMLQQNADKIQPLRLNQLRRTIWNSMQEMGMIERRPPPKKTQEPHGICPATKVFRSSEVLGKNPQSREQRGKNSPSRLNQLLL